MEGKQLALRQIASLMSALIYWGSVIINAYRVRKYIGKSPNLTPETLKEKLLWFGWFIVISGWIGQPLIIEKLNDLPVFSFIMLLFHPIGIPLGIFLAVCGYAGTLWCYSVIGDSWRIGVNKNERTALVTHGPYRFVRHPIYSFQIMILAGATLLLPNLFSLVILIIHFFCVLIKSLDEEAYLLITHASEYKEYYSRTGRFLPRGKTLSF